MAFRSQQAFYHSKEWEKFRLQVIAQRTEPDGFVRCAHCGQPIVRKYDLILHHVKELSDSNVNDYSISLNPENIWCVHHACHNAIHGAQPGGRNKGYKPPRKEAWLIWGAPYAGKADYAAELATANDLVVNIETLWDAVAPLGNAGGDHPTSRKTAVFAMRDALFDVVKHRAGNWHKVYIVATVPLARDRERLTRQLNLTGATLIDTAKSECLERAANLGGSASEIQEREQHVTRWFDRYQPDTQA